MMQIREDPSLDVLEALMDAAWPAVECSTADGWVLRSAGGVTQRANSIWPVAGPADAAPGLRDAEKLRDAENWYAARRQPVIFQLTRREANAALEALLDAQGYSRQSETIIMTAEVPPAEDVVRAGITVTLTGSPSTEWLDLWWRVDGRGGGPEKAMALDIMTTAPSLYATARTAEGVVVGTGRLTVLERRAGIYCMAVDPDFRRRGIAASVMAALRRAAHEAQAQQLWLMVTAANTGAQALYQGAGFLEAGRYHYRQAPLQRASGAC